MRIPLADLAPEWIDSGERRKLGVTFLCPECGNHRVACWWMKPADGGDPPTLSEDVPMLYWHEGETFEELCIYPPIRHGAEVVLVMHEGMINILEL